MATVTLPPVSSTRTVRHLITGRELVVDAGAPRQLYCVSQRISVRPQFNRLNTRWVDLPTFFYVLTDEQGQEPAQFLHISLSNAAMHPPYAGPFCVRAANPLTQSQEDIYLPTVQELADFLRQSAQKSYGGILTTAAPDNAPNGAAGLYYVGFTDETGQPDQWQ